MKKDAEGDEVEFVENVENLNRANEFDKIEFKSLQKRGDVVRKCSSLNRYDLSIVYDEKFAYNEENTRV